MRASSVRRVIVHSPISNASHSVVLDADPWPDNLRLSDIEAQFTCPPAASAVPVCVRIFRRTDRFVCRLCRFFP
jgi:hypothetical protein